MNAQAEKTTSSGVETLLQRLREEGVANGQAQAEKIVAEAESRAKWLVDQAQEEAEQLRSKARTDADKFKTGGEEALRVAARDTLLGVKTELTQTFAHEVKRLVGEELSKEDMLRQLILEVAGRVSEQAAGAEHLEVLLPRDVVGVDELRQRPEELGQDKLSLFVKSLSEDLIRGEGVTFGVAEDNLGGIRLHIVDQEIVLDLSDQAIAALLLRYLQPRFRALLEGIVK